MPEAIPSGDVLRRMPAPASLRVLVLDDSRVDRRRIERLCREADIEVDLEEAATLQAFTEALEGPPFDLFVIDYRLGEGDGLIALETLNRHPVQRAGASIMVAGEGPVQVAVDAMKAGCGDFLLKDHLSADVLLRAMSGALDRRAAALGAPRQPAHPSPGSGHFVRENAAEMRSILSSMLRHVRTLRRAGGPEAALQGVEASAARLWNFLEALKAAERAARGAGAPRLN